MFKSYRHKLSLRWRRYLFILDLNMEILFGVSFKADTQMRNNRIELKSFKSVRSLLRDGEGVILELVRQLGLKVAQFLLQH